MNLEISKPDQINHAACANLQSDACLADPKQKTADTTSSETNMAVADLPTISFVAERANASDSSNETGGTREDVIVPTTQAERQRLDYLQQTLVNLLPLAFNGAEDREHLNKLQESLYTDIAGGVFGEPSRTAYGKFVSWLEKRALPETLKDLETLEIKTPRPDWAKETDGQVHLDLNTNEIPSLDNLKQLNSAFDWLADSKKEITVESGKREEQFLKDYIEKNGLPSSWLPGQGADLEQWRRDAMFTVGLTRWVGNYVQAMDELYKASPNRDFPRTFPPGTTVERDPNGNITSINLDLPSSVDSNDPANREKVDRLLRWLGDFGPTIEQATSELSQIATGKKEPIMWGDVEVHGVKAKLDQQRQLIDFVDPAKISDGDLKDGETLENMNLIEYRFDITHDANGKIIVTPKIQAQKAYLYLNLGYQNVGEPKELSDASSRTYDPEEFVPIQVGKRVQIIKAKDLHDFKFGKQAEHYSEKIMTPVFDATMLFTGVTELTLALRAGRFAARLGGLTAGAAMRDFGMPAVKGLTNAVLGGSGFAINNAGARDTDTGVMANTIRHYAFMGQAGLNALRTGLSYTGFAPTSPSRIEAILEHTSSGTVLPAIFRGAGKAGEYTGYAYLPLVGTALENELRDKGLGRFHAENARQLVDSTVRVRFADSKQSNSDLTDVTPERLSDYEAAITRDSNDETRKKVQAIFAATSDALAPGSNQQKREELRKYLSTLLSFDGKEIKELEIAQGAQLTARELDDLRDPEKRNAGKFSHTTKSKAEELLKSRNPDVRQAAQVALVLLMAADNQDNVTFDTSVPATNEYILRYNTKNKPVATTPLKIEDHEVAQNVSREDLRRALYREFEHNLDNGKKLTFAHAMYSAGIMTAAQLQFVLRQTRGN